jgi:hypothetical protein
MRPAASQPAPWIRVVCAFLVSVGAASVALPQPAAFAASGTVALGGPGTQSIEAVTPVAGGFLAVGSSSGVAAAWYGNATGALWKRLSAPETLAFPGQPGSSASGLATGDTGTVVSVGYEIESPVHPKPGGYPTDALFWRAANGRDLRLVTKQSHEGDDSYRADAATFGDGVFAAVGNREVPSGKQSCGAPVAWYSKDDGRSWTDADLPIPNGAGGSVHAVTWSSGFGFVAVGETFDTRCDSHATGALWTSDDGETWTASTSAPDGYSLRGIAATGDRVVVVGSGQNDEASPCYATYWSSEDLTSWKSTDPDATQRANGVTALANDSFVAVGTTCSNTTPAHAVAYTSTNGNHWTLAYRDKASRTGITEMIAVAPKGARGYVIVGTQRNNGTAWWT